MLLPLYEGDLMVMRIEQALRRKLSKQAEELNQRLQKVEDQQYGITPPNLPAGSDVLGGDSQPDGSSPKLP